MTKNQVLQNENQDLRVRAERAERRAMKAENDLKIVAMQRDRVEKRAVSLRGAIDSLMGGLFQMVEGASVQVTKIEARAYDEMVQAQEASRIGIGSKSQ